jgi:DmX-like protein
LFSFQLRCKLYTLLILGGSEWTLEDTIELKNVEIPNTSAAYSDVCGIQIVVPDSHDSASCGQLGDGVLDSRSQRLIQLDWVSTEDGGHILTVGVGSQIRLYAAVAGDVALVLQASNSQTMAVPVASRGVLQKSKSMAVPNNAEAAAARERRWVQIRVVDLMTADGRPPTPLNISWVRNGILVVGLDSEMHVYSQWRCPGSYDETPETVNVVNSNVPTASLSVSASFLLPPASGLPKSMSSMKLDASIASLSLLAEKDRRRSEHRSSVSVSRETSASVQATIPIRDCGLFEAARRASPVLPQYHPRQLIELLNFGKIRRVKAILSHLLRCIAGGNMELSDTIMGHRSPMDNSGIGSGAVGTGGQDEPSTDYVEIMSIPPLPLYALLAADTDVSFGAGLDSVTSAARNPVAARGGSADYTSLFTVDAGTDDVLDDPFDEAEGVTGPSRAASTDMQPCASGSGSGLLNFTPAQAHRLARHLTHTQLPGMSSLDQMYLLAVAETVANTRADFTDANAAARPGNYKFSFAAVYIFVVVIVVE